MENTDINISALENVDIDRILKEAIKEKIEKLMETELNAYLEENPGIKNGKYKRDLKTKYGEIKQLNVPRDRDSNFHTQVIEPYNRSIGMEDLIVSMYSNGISTRRIAGIMEDILGNKYSKSTISRITDLTIEEVYKFINRPLDKRYIAVFLDGLFFYLRRGNVDKEPVIFALGIKETGEYEVLGFYLTVKESHNAYKEVLEDLYNRGLKEPLLIVADGIKNLDEEVMEIYPRSEFQLCTIHYARGLKSNVREKDIDEITIDANKMFKCDNKEEAIIRFNDFKYKWKSKYPKVIYNTEKNLGKLLRFYNYPVNIRKSLKSTNAIERFNGEVRRRVKTISSFPDEDSAMKVFYYKSIEYNSKHAFRKMNGYYKCKDEIKEMFQKRYPL
ncbi:IS256-like element ISFac8 family transposase [Ferroplasma acidarmanus]|uniref:Transposase (04) n=1 Tax=Ferroplasma acidarmanus Fer1 TaxID=333146 RepID=S0APA6_FERAC|nr:IS256-like element ISFac8 family transposase [Ferroplasma acidarmanus]AGO60731.1 transposase (04) [Ferroplasma acidarmanus Fer1]